MEQFAHEEKSKNKAYEGCGHRGCHWINIDGIITPYQHESKKWDFSLSHFFSNMAWLQSCCAIFYDIHEIATANFDIHSFLRSCGYRYLRSKWIITFSTDLTFNLNLTRHATNDHNYGHRDITKIAIVRAQRTLVVGGATGTKQVW